jgi:purine-binding chemotaxis protein CheW
MNQAAATTQSFVLLTIKNTTYGIASEAIRQIEMVESITPVPNASPFVEGLVFSRGHVVPALNLRLRFGFERIPHDARTRLVIVARHDRVVGLLVDSAREFVAIPVDAIQPPPEGLAELSGQYLESVARLGDRLVLILDVDEVLNFAEGSSLPAQPA